VDGSFVGFCSGLPSKWGFVRQRVGADKSVCRGAGSLAKSLIFTPAVMGWPNWSVVTYRLPNLGGRSRRLLSTGHRLIYVIHRQFYA
jgi:hypothetical protein